MQSQQMAAMAGMNAAMGPVDGTPVMSSMQRPGGRPDDPRTNLNTYIYDYFMRNNYGRLAKAMLECDLKMNLAPHTKPSPSGRNMNGMDSMDPDVKDDLPQPKIPDGQSADNSFLLDWWCQFWDIYRAARDKNGSKAQHQYIGHTRQLAHIQNQQRDQRMQMNGYQNMMRAGIPNGVPVNDLKRAAAMNNRNPSNPNQMANMNQMKSQMMSAQMQRDGSGMDMNGQRPQSPGSTENAPSPNKRPRVEGNNFNGQQMGVARSQGMQQQPMGATSAAQANQMLLAGGMNSGFNEFAPQAQNVQQKSIEGMNSGVQGSPMTQPGLDGQQEIFAGNMVRPGMPAGAPGQPGQGNHALQDYQMQLMLLEQQNKKRLLMARQEQDNMSAGPHGQPPVGAPGFPPSMSPQGSRAGPSPNPNDQIKRGTPKMNQPGLPGSPMGDASMQQNRNSPAPNMNFEQMPPGMPPQFYNPQMPQNPMMRPPSSHPGGNFNGQQLTQQMEQMRHNGAMQNGAWRGPPQGMMQNQGQQLGPMNTPQQQRNPMPPPPAPPAGEQPRAQEPSPSQPAQAPPTPSQTNKANPKKKPTKDNKKPAKSKAANTGATPAASGEEPPPTPTPSTPITPMHPKSFTGQNGQPPAQPQAQPPPAAPAPQQQQPVEPFGNISGEPDDFGILNGFDGSDALENFDFDSFLHVGDDNGAFSSLGGDFGFGDGVEAGGEL